MGGYVHDLRMLVGSRALILAGACTIMVDRLGRILLQRRTDDGLWGLPGGMMEIGETIEETAKREVFEEVGLTVGDLTFFHVFSGPEVYHKYPHGDEVYNVIVAFISHSFHGTIRSDDGESSEACFFYPQEIPENLSLDRVVVERYLSQNAGMTSG